MELFIMCGPPGTGKSTWVKNFIESADSQVKVVSRDEIRFAKLQESEDYFNKENEVFDDFIKQLNSALHDSQYDAVIADATHLTQRSRNKVLDQLDLENVEIIPVAMLTSITTALARNEKRTGRAHVPVSVIKRMFYQFEFPDDNEKYQYASILEVDG